jgi:tetratricopeptide (TPR) repeat protein
MWDVQLRAEVVALDSTTSITNLPLAVAFSPDGTRLATAGFRRLEFWDGAVLPAGNEPKPPNAAFYATRGAYLEENRRWNEAIVAFSKALQLQPRDEQILELRGSAFAEVNRWDEAAADFTSALNADPDDLRLRLERALAIFQIGNRQMFDSDRLYLVREAERMKIPAAENAAAFLSALLPKPSFDLDRAVKLARDATESVPKEYSYASTLGSILYRDGRDRECIKELNVAMKLNQPAIKLKQPGTPFDWVVLAMAEAHLGLTDKSSLLRTEERIQRVETDPLFQDPTWNWDWSSRAMMKMLMDEARPLLEMGTNPPPSSEDSQAARHH